MINTNRYGVRHIRIVYRSIAFYFCPFLCTKTINVEHSNSTIVFSWFWFSDDIRSLFGWGFICLASCQFSSFNKMVTLDLVIWYGFRLFFCLFIYQGHWSQNPSSYSLNQNWPNIQILFCFFYRWNTRSNQLLWLNTWDSFICWRGDNRLFHKNWLESCWRTRLVTSLCLHRIKSTRTVSTNVTNRFETILIE